MRAPSEEPSDTPATSPNGERTIARIETSSPRTETGSSSVRPRGSGVARRRIDRPGRRRAASSGNGVREKSLRQPPTRGSDRCGTPSIVNVVPEGTFPDSRSTRVAGSAGAARSTGTSCEKSSVRTYGAGTAYAASSDCPRASVERYVVAKRASPRLATRKVAVAAADPGLRASESAASRSATRPRPPMRPSARRAGASTRAATTAAAKVTSAGTSRRNVPVRPFATSSYAPTEPRARPTTTTASAPPAATSSGVRPSLPTCTAGTRTAAYSNSAAAAATASALASPSPETRACATTSPAGDPARSATTAVATAPSAHPTAVAASATAAASANVESSTCHRRAPCHTSRRLASPTCRRSASAASSVNASRSAAPSPPSSNSRRDDARDAAVAVASCSVGAVTWNWSECAATVARSPSSDRWNSPIAHGWTSAEATGTNQAYERKKVASSGARERPSTPSASTTGAGCGVW